MLVRILIFVFASALVWGQAPAAPPDPDVARELAEMRAVIQQLQQRVGELEARLGPAAASGPARPAVVQAEAAQAAVPFQDQSSQDQSASSAPATSNLLHGTSVSGLVDMYYDYNFNDPIGRVNRLRAYDVLSNAFSLNQADVIFENAADPGNGKRWGARLDLQFGQATETLQGNAANELRPEVYQNIFQAYGTYVVPVGSGLTVDFGKWASSIGFENNYSQDQINYSRSYWFNFLPYYHMGARVNYQLAKKLALNYWVVNGTEQTEPFNDFKDELVGLVIQPNKNISWTVNYYLGQEHPNVELLPNSTNPDLPTLQGTPFLPIAYAPKGKLHIIDSYVSWQASPQWSFGLEADYVIERMYTNSYPQVTWGGAGYARYQISPRVAIAGRAEYMSDGGLFSMTPQALKETTLTFEQRLHGGFLLREEYRRDFSNQPYFYTDLLGVLKREQNTATLGVVWWFGPKKSPW